MDRLLKARGKQITEIKKRTAQQQKYLFRNNSHNSGLFEQFLTSFLKTVCYLHTYCVNGGQLMLSNMIS